MAQNVSGDLFQRGDFTLASGQKSMWKIECDALSDGEWDTLALMLMDYLPHPFARVYGVPRGGLPLADALLKWVDPTAERTLVVDDVWTTGWSMNRFVDGLPGADPIVMAVVFARNPVPPEVMALFSVPR